MRHIPALDGLRAIAVLAVVAYHAGLPVPAGFVGVDVFFVISGYLITRLLHDEIQSTGRIDFMAFYARRARRILPALVVVVAVTVALSTAFLAPNELQQTMQAGASSLLFAGNLFFYAQPAGYFDANADASALLHLWSLGVEEQFYIVWPLVLILARKKPVAALSVLALLSFALAEYWLLTDAKAAFYQMPARAWELSLGGLVAMRPVQLPKGSAWAGLVITVAACFVPLGHFPGVGALPAVMGAALLIAAIQGGQRCWPLETRPMVGVGLISYSLYLWHWPLLKLSDATPALLVAGAFGLAYVSYRWIETPFRKGRWPARATVLVAVSILAIGSAAGFTSASKIAVESDFTAVVSPVYAKGCDDWYQSAEVKPCVFGNPSGARTVVIMGDSVGMQWFPAVDKEFTARGWRIVALTKSSCPMVDAPFYYDRIGRLFTECEQWRKSALAFVAELAPDLLILGSTDAYGFGREQWIEGTRSVLEASSARSVRIIRSTPTLSGSGEQIVYRWQQEAIIGRSDTRTVDMNDLVEAGKDSGVFRDERHITAAFAESVSGQLMERLAISPTQ